MTNTNLSRPARLKTFLQRFGRGHYDLACHAAFPLALTPELLYQIWGAFPRDNDGASMGVPWIAVADVLLHLCDEVGHEVYAFAPDLRVALLQELRSNPRFGYGRIGELTALVQAFVLQQLHSDNPFLRDFAEAQRWSALAEGDPQTAASEIAAAYADGGLDDRARVARLSALVEALAAPMHNGDIESLLPYACALAEWAEGSSDAAQALASLAQNGTTPTVGGVRLPLPTTLVFPTTTTDVQQAQIPTISPQTLDDVRQQYERARLRLEELEQRQTALERSAMSKVAPPDLAAQLAETSQSLAEARAQAEQWLAALLEHIHREINDLEAEQQESQRQQRANGLNEVEMERLGWLQGRIDSLEELRQSLLRHEEAQQIQIPEDIEEEDNQISGSTAEKTILNILISLGYVAREATEVAIFHSPIDQIEPPPEITVTFPNRYFVRQFPIGSSIYKSRLYGDFFLQGVPSFPQGIVIELKWQQSQGSVDEKFPYLVLNIQQRYFYPVVVIADGGGQRPGALQWLRNQVGNNLVGVYTLAEFLDWANHNLSASAFDITS